MLSWFGIKSQGSEASDKQETSNETSDVSSSQTEVEALTEQPKDENVSDSSSGPNSGSSPGNAVPVGIAGAFGFLRNIATAAGKTAHKLKESVDETLDKTIIGDLERENQKFVREKHTKRTEDPVPPWVGYNEEEDMKTQILALSADERHFLRDPPSGVDFYFELDAVMPIALTILQEDKKLQAMRFKLVPSKVKEERFWRNYFYRVSLIKQSSQLSTLATSEFKRSSSSLNQEGNRNSKSDLEKAAIDEAANDDISKTQTQSKTEESRLNSEASSERADGSTSVKGDPLSHDWEKELQDELQDFEFVSEDQGDNHESNPEWEKEIENMLGLDEEEDLESKTK